MNAAASYQVAREIAVFARVENQLNEDYQEVFAYEAAGMTAYAGMRFAFDAAGSGK